ncbi:MAG: Gldg family protein [Cyanobacteria bacterium J06626_18]
MKFLAWPGLMMVTAGLVAGSLSGWQPLPIGLVIFGAGLVLLGLSFSGKTAGAFWQQRSTQVGTNAAISVIALLVILGLVNFLGVKYSTRLDLTETRLYTLAPASQSIVRELDRPVRLVVFDTVQNPQDVQLLEGYRRLNDQFSYDYIDPFADPVTAQAFNISQPGAVFLEVGEDRRFLQTVGDPANPQTLGTPEVLSERQLTNALEQIVSDRTLTVYFVQGHEEYPIGDTDAGLQQAISGLEEKNYVVNPLDLTETQSVPEDASVVVVAGPAQDFLEAEVDALTDYLAAGGGVFLMLDPRTDAGLNSLLDDWGILLDDSLVLDLSGAGQFAELGPAALIVTDYGDHPITQEFGNGRSFFPIARPVETRDLPSITSTPLLITNAQSRAESIADDGNLSFDPEAPPDGPYVLGAALSRPVETATTNTDVGASNADEATADADVADTEETPPQAAEARMVLIGNSRFATDGTFEQQLNGDIFLNAVSWLGREGDATLSIRPKTVTNRRILMSAQQAWGLSIFSLLILPATGLALAIVMALQRR